MTQSLSATAFTEAVLLVENDPEIVRHYQRKIANDGVEILEALRISDARRKVSELVDQDVQTIVVLLDLMFDEHDTEEGLTFLRELKRLDPFKEARWNVVVLTGADDPQTKAEVSSAGIRAFHTKPADPELVMQDIRYYLGKETSVASSLLEIVHVDNETGQMDVRYRTSHGANVRCTLDWELAPLEARVAGGSFWLDVSKHFEAGRAVYRSSGRLVDAAHDADFFKEFLD